MARGYIEGPAADERLDALEDRRPAAPVLPDRPAVYGSTATDPERHFIGWVGEVDPDKLFASGKAWGIQVVRRKQKRR